MRTDLSKGIARDPRPTAAERAIALALAAMMLTGAVPALAEPGETRSTLDGVISSGEYSDMYVIEDGVYEVAWNIVDEDIHLALRAHTTGWIALGLNPSDGMLDADMLMGYVDSGGTAHVEDQWSTGQNGPHTADTDLGGTFDIIEWNGTEEGGYTSIELIRNLTTTDARDKPFPTNGTLSFIWAIGGSDDWESKHTNVGYGSIDVGTGESKERVVVKLWPLHAVLMSLGVGLMLVGYAVLRRKKTYKKWFRAHILTNSVAVAASAAGLLLGLYMIEQSTGVHLRVPHTWIGLVTLVVAIVVLALGFAFRKVKPASKRSIWKVHLWLGWAGVALMVLTLLSGLYTIVLGL